MTDPSASETTLLTVGHGRLDRQGLGELLTGAGVQQVVDIRRYPASRSNEDSRREALEQWLRAAGIDYRWEPALGGRRRLTAEQDAQTPDTWWRVAQFRAYAAYTRTTEFAEALDHLLTQARTARTAVLCSESVWWRCHRRIVADVAVLTGGMPVAHLMHQGKLVEHPVSDGARVRAPDGAVVWDGPDPGGSQDAEPSRTTRCTASTFASVVLCPPALLHSPAQSSECDCAAQ